MELVVDDRDVIVQVRVVGQSLGALRELLFGSGLLTPALQSDARYLLQDLVPPAYDDVTSLQVT